MDNVETMVENERHYISLRDPFQFKKDALTSIIITWLNTDQ